MIAAFFPLKKLRRNGKYFLFGMILLVGVAAVYHEMVAAKAWSSDNSMNPNVDGWRGSMFDERVRRDHQPDSVKDSGAWRSSYTPQTWKPEYKGQANLHVFDDWCGSSTADLRKNLHYPLYPHSRNTVQKLAVSPRWTNYGLRIFGYLHPYADGNFVFAVSSDDNSELWLSTDDSPLNLQLLSWVGKTGREWTAPGEFEKYASQTSKPLWLSAQRRYFFEVIHKQDNRGTDHVEVAWQLLDKDFKFRVIESRHISLYVNESAFLMSDVGHIPQTVASHQHTPTKQQSAAADMLREDSRDTAYQVPLLNSKFLQGVLPDCLYQPSYIIKDFPLMRYQGLQFVHLSYIYPNDYTRLTHMETENTCFYHESPYYMKRFGFSRYMILDHPGVQEKGQRRRDFSFQGNKSVLDGYDEDEFDNEAYHREKEVRRDKVDNALFPDYGDDYDDYARGMRRKLFSLVMNKTNNTLKNTSNTRQHVVELQRRQRKNSAPQPQSDLQKPAVALQSTQGSKHLPSKQQNQTESKLQGRVKKAKKIKPKTKFKLAKKQKSKSVEATVRPEQKNPLIPVDRKTVKAKVRPAVLSEQLNSEEYYTKRPRTQNPTLRFEGVDDEELTPAPEFDPEVSWSQTFQVNHLDLQAQRSDWIDLTCNISGNLLLHSSDALPIAHAFMEHLNEKHHGEFTLVRVINVVKRMDGVQGSRYLLELELKDGNGKLLRLSYYIYALIRHSRRRRQDIFQRPKPQLLLCNPVGFRWNPVATVNFIVPVKNQARWVQQIIADMEQLFRETGDANFNLIITDYNSTDIDVRKALQKSSLPRYQYVKLSGNFKRSAGLQAGVDLINDDHSIVFLCDLHIHFPPSIIDTIRKHCVEGYMAFAPIVLRLDCGATPLDAKGYWEVNGFGLLGIYKSDLDKVGGMNTREFSERWGGEDWELLDRILQGGLEVERIYMRNFFHHFHSKRGMWNHRTWPSHS
ncbi:beta-1,4-N-acetylgalactosaminyltransferase 3 [Centropristis striata]|uniref:beta-1,4-N-acetylgalactosaminyltransferase 3 n=1 Tax=Centropristis striata TaxID=184440 RepID=UPI0027E065BC|nr:beta-1,4-N-acetylgalactosaminyltransferase 3 [Centropristis striata]